MGDNTLLYIIGGLAILGGIWYLFLRNPEHVQGVKNLITSGNQDVLTNTLNEVRAGKISPFEAQGRVSRLGGQ